MLTCHEQGTRTQAAFREQIVELHGAGRSAEDLAREFEPCVATIHTWIGQAERDGGRRADILSSEEREELCRLRRENKQLRQERDILSRAATWFCTERCDRSEVFEFTMSNQAEFPIEIMARSMGVSRSGFHAWQSREPSARDIADRELTELIHQIHAASRDSYGAPRIHAELADSGVQVGRKRIERLTRAAGLAGVSRRRCTRTTIRDDRVRPSADLVDRNFYADGPEHALGR